MAKRGSGFAILSALPAAIFLSREKDPLFVPLVCRMIYCGLKESLYLLSSKKIADFFERKVSCDKSMNDPTFFLTAFIVSCSEIFI